MRGIRFHRRIILAVLAVALVPPLCYLAWDQWTYNFGEVQPGEIYRSGQMPADALTETIRDRGIKTVLNLRGDNPQHPWYRAECAATIASGATLVDIPMSSCEWMSRLQLRAVIEVLETYERPILVHCQWGSERTGLVSTFAELLRPGATLDDAKRQISLRYLYVRVGDGKVMAEHIDAYESWLKTKSQGHSPEQFRRWVIEGYVPKIPSREFWPSDPKPVALVTRPEEKSAILDREREQGPRR